MVILKLFILFLLSYAVAAEVTKISREYDFIANKAAQAQDDLSIETHAQSGNLVKPNIVEEETPSKFNNALEEAVIEQTNPKQSSIATETEVTTTTYFPCQSLLPIGYPCLIANGFIPGAIPGPFYGGQNNYPGPYFQPGFSGPNFGNGPGANFYPAPLGPNFIPGQPGLNFLPGQQGPNTFPGQMGSNFGPGQQGPVVFPPQPGSFLGQQGPNFVPGAGQGPFGIPDPNFGGRPGFVPGLGFPGAQGFQPGSPFPNNGFNFPFSTDNRGQQELASLNRAPASTNPRILSDTEYDTNGGYVYKKPKLGNLFF